MAENYITKQAERGTVNISEDVIAVMVSATVTEVEGVAGFGAATTPEYYSTRIGGNQNGEFMSGSHFTKTILARLWVNE